MICARLIWSASARTSTRCKNNASRRRSSIFDFLPRSPLKRPVRPSCEGVCEFSATILFAGTAGDRDSDRDPSDQPSQGDAPAISGDALVIGVQSKRGAQHQIAPVVAARPAGFGGGSVGVCAGETLFFKLSGR